MLNLLSPQANKRQKLLESQKASNAIGEDNASGSDDSAEEEEEQHMLPSVATSVITDLGAAPASNDKYRDENFYLGYDRGDNRYAEEGFAVGSRGQDMVLDMAGDENVRSQCKHCRLVVAQSYYGVHMTSTHAAVHMVALSHSMHLQ